MWWSTPSPRSFCGLIRESRRAECLLSACDFFLSSSLCNRQTSQPVTVCCVTERANCWRGSFLWNTRHGTSSEWKRLVMLLCLQFNWKKLCCCNIKPEGFLRDQRHEMQISSPKIRCSSIRSFKQFPFNTTESVFKQPSRYHMHQLQFYWVLLASTAEFGLATICLEAWKKWLLPEIPLQVSSFCDVLQNPALKYPGKDGWNSSTVPENVFLTWKDISGLKRQCNLG